MKLIKLICALVIITAYAASLRADVVIYRVKQTGKLIGSGQEVALKGFGYTLIDPDSKAGYSIFAASVMGQKIFLATSLTNSRVYTVNGAKGKSYTVIASSGQGGLGDRNLISKGLNASLAIKADRTISFPRVIAGSGGTLIGDPSDAGLLEAKGTAIYSQTDTRAANQSGETVQDTFQRIRQQLIDQGYAEAPEL